MLEKGKGSMLRKLRNMTLIEEDLQLNMTIYFLADIKELIKDDYLLKANFGSRKNCTIDSALL